MNNNHTFTESSAAVETAFQLQEKIDSDVQVSFDKLSEVIVKAEQFNLKGKNFLCQIGLVMQTEVPK